MTTRGNLVLGIKPGTKIALGNGVLITVLKIAGQMRLAIEAPKDMRIYRDGLIPEELEDDR